MCVIAGYIGNRPAAPILLEMLKREEGLNAGFYSGIATIHDGKLHYRKVIGDAAALARETSALSLPGTIGIIHGRTNSGGGVEWGHPFVDVTGDLAYIANGSRGQYTTRRDFLAQAGDELLRLGHCFKSAQNEAVSAYPVFSNGQSAHMSDVMCHVIAEALRTSSAPSDHLLHAARSAFETYPGEIVGLCLHASQPDEIVAVRHNRPLTIGRDKEGSVYMASTALAFPVPMIWRMRMPAASGALIKRDGSVQIVPFTSQKAVPLIPPGDLPSPLAVNRCLETAMQKGLKELWEPCSVKALLDAVRAFWPIGVLDQKEVVVFEMLEALLAEGRITLSDRTVPGANGEGAAPETWVEWQHSKP